MLIQKYTERWTQDFEDLKRELEKEIPGFHVAILHVGSTSVPFLDAKPIIDIDIVYRQAADFKVIKTSLLTLGYYHNGNQGIEKREVFKRREGLRHEILDAISHHLYVCPTDSPAFERHLLCRNYLRKNEWARVKYQQMKYALAAEAGQDRKKYAALKELKLNSFIDSIVNQEKAVAQLTWQFEVPK